MKAPKCPLCGKEEWRHVCTAASKEIVRQGTVVPRGDAIKAQVTKPAVPVDKKRSKVPFDRTAYQRELMRKRRASKRAKVLGDGGKADGADTGSSGQSL